MGGKVKLARVGWTLFGLALLIAAGYVLNRGLFIGSEMLPEPITVSVGRKLTLYSKRCHYLHFTGTRYRQTLGQESHTRVDEMLCPMFEDQISK
jgi:hypothetical protein